MAVPGQLTGREPGRCRPHRLDLGVSALAAMAMGNGAELYAVTARGTESDIGHPIFLIAFSVLIVASALLGQVFIRRRWIARVRWAGLLLLLALHSEPCSQSRDGY